MKAYAAKVNATYADYFSALVDEKGFLKRGSQWISTDGSRCGSGDSEGFALGTGNLSFVILRKGTEDSFHR
jgi:hypothetical protein